MQHPTEPTAKSPDPLQRYQAIFHHAAIGIARLSLDGHWLEVNEKLCQIIGHPDKELLALTFQEITDPRDLAKEAKPFERLINGDIQTYTLDKRYLRGDGEAIWTAQSLSLVCKASGEADYLVSVIQDIDERKRIERSLRQSELRTRAVIDATQDGFVTSDVNGHIIDANDSYCRMSGYTLEELTGMRLDDLDDREDSEGMREHIDRVIKQGNDIFETIHRRKNGERWPVEVTVNYSAIDGGRFFAFLRDIRERHISQAMLRLRQRISDTAHHGTQEEVMRVALDAAEELSDSQIGFFHFVDPDQQNLSLQIWSTRTLETFCFAEGKGLHYPVSEAGVWVDCIHQRRPVIHNDYGSLPHRKGLPEGHAPILRELTTPIFRENLIVGVIGVGNKSTLYTEKDVELVNQIADLAFDYVERKKAETRIEHMAFYDLLTGLPNRTLLFDRLKQAIALSKRSNRVLALAYLDLDGFKPINDQFGHHTGDHLLTSLAQRLVDSLREGDTLARLGGDEFALLLSDLPHNQECDAILDRVLDGVSRPFIIDDHELRVTASIGYTLYPLDKSDPDTLLRHADLAMYQAKNRGKNQRYLFDPAHDKRMTERQTTLQEFDQAIEKGELLLYYQPKIYLPSAEVVGAEALIRWAHPQRGLLSPGLFLPVLENTEQEIRLGQWVIGQALRQIATWYEDGTPIPVSINISPNHLHQANFVDFIVSASAAYSPQVIRYLEIEILESTAVTDFEQLAEVLEACSKLGIRFALDDFGTGYSSLTYFHRLPIDLLKIDQHFVRGMLDDADDLNIVEGVVRLAQAYNCPSIAEGVESIELAALLLDLGCPLAQGYGIAHPMPAAHLSEWRASWPQDPRCQDLRAIDPEQSPDALLQIAIHHHQRWIDTLAEYLESGGASEPPSIDPKQCNFSRWYNGLGRFRYADRPRYPFLAPRHHALHQLAGELIKLMRQGEKGRQQSLRRLPDLYALRDEFVGMLRQL